MPFRIMAEDAQETFEQRLDRLSALVEELEQGELPLEQAMVRFEAGQKLHQELLAELQGYEKRVEKLVQGAHGQDQLEEQVRGPVGDAASHD